MSGQRSAVSEQLVEHVDRMVQESGRPEGFDVARWTNEWIETPAAALGGRRPVELLDTSEGQRLVIRLLASLQSGAYW